MKIWKGEVGWGLQFQARTSCQLWPSQCGPPCILFHRICETMMICWWERSSSTWCGWNQDEFPVDKKFSPWPQLKSACKLYMLEWAGKARTPTFVQKGLKILLILKHGLLTFRNTSECWKMNRKMEFFYQQYKVPCLQFAWFESLFTDDRLFDCTAFQSFDANGDGYITRGELSRILCCKGYDKLTEDEFKCVSMFLHTYKYWKTNSTHITITILISG